MCDLWWKKWRWDNFFFQYFGFTLSVSFHQCSVSINFLSQTLRNLIIWQRHFKIHLQKPRLQRLPDGLLMQRFPAERGSYTTVDLSSWEWCTTLRRLFVQTTAWQVGTRCSCFWSADPDRPFLSLLQRAVGSGAQQRGQSSASSRNGLPCATVSW